MTNYATDTARNDPWWLRPRPVGLVLALIILAFYLATLAQGLVLGDPSEYTFVANLPAIAHPPGYAFFTLTGWLIQHLLPLGDFPWRMHLLSALSGTTAALAVYGTVWQVTGAQGEGTAARRAARLAAAFLAALLVASGANFWQHSIHANPHIVTATFMAVNLFLLTRWATRPAGGDHGWGWLWLFCLSAGLGVTHHPLTVFSFPGYALFILLVRPRILREWPRLLAMIAFAALGLLPLLYFPLRSATGPLFGPETMDTLDGFLAHFLARGLSDSLPYYTLAEQPLRQVVFASIVRLQMGWPLALLAVWGVIGFGRAPAAGRADGRQMPAGWQFALLFLTVWLVNYGFVISLKQQDIMAYLLGPLLLLGLLAGLGAFDLWRRLRWRFDGRSAAVFLLLISLLGPGWNLLANAPRISLRQFDEGERHVAAVFDYFDGRGEGAVLLNNWEFMTPLWYTRFVKERWPDPADVRPEFVSAAEPWLPSVFNYLPGGPVYLNGYRREIVDAGFRLRPRGPFYQVVEPGDRSVPPELTPLEQPAAEEGPIELVAFELPQREVTAGDFVPLTLAMRTGEETAEFFMPVLQVGSLRFPFTTDSHLITPLWQPGEIIVEPFGFALPHDLPAGDYPLSVYIENLSRGERAGGSLDLGLLTVSPHPAPPPADDLLANFRQRVGLVEATAWRGSERREAPWQRPLAARPGEVVNTFLTWEALDRAEESYTVFFHLIDPADRLYAALDYTPLGGAVPTHLWFPKWLPGQQVVDPYRLVIPPELPPGRYLIEVGLYEMTSGRRLHMHDPAGNLVGDRYILGEVVVEPAE